MKRKGCLLALLVLLGCSDPPVTSPPPPKYDSGELVLLCRNDDLYLVLGGTFHAKTFEGLKGKSEKDIWVYTLESVQDKSISTIPETKLCDLE